MNDFILRTKLIRPVIDNDALERPKLLERLDLGLDRALTLVSAPAGFGKSTLISQWVGSLDDSWNACWYSVDPSDDNLREFLLYVVTAIREHEPDACPQSMELVQAADLPEASLVARVFINEALDLKKKILFVLDDFHRLSDPSIHHFLTTLLSYPPPNFHWVILARRDPALALSKMRMLGNIQEIRMDDLRFSREDIQAFLSTAVDGELSDDLIAVAEEKMNGWAVAMQLMVVSLKNRGGGAAVQWPSLPAEVSEHLIEEIFTDVSTSFREIVIRMALFDRFCQGLSQAVMPEAKVSDFYAWLKTTNMFVVNPAQRDGEDGWFCFHPFFREALLKFLKVAVPDEEIKMMHQRAAEWFDCQGLVQESIAEALLSGNAILAGEIVENHLQRPEWQGDYFLRDRWLAELPLEVVDQSAVLMIAAAWKKYRANTDWISAVKKAELAAGKGTMNEKSARWVQANLACLRCAYHYTKREFQEAIDAGTSALSSLSPEQTHLRAVTVGMLSLSFRSHGENAAALRVINEGRELCQSDPAAIGVILIADSHRYLMSMDMSGLLSSATHCLEHCEKHDLLSIADVARVLAGFACYQLNDLQQAERHLARTDLELARMDYRNVIWTQCYLVLTYAAQDRWRDADALVSQLLNDVRSQPNPLFLDLVESIQAELALRRGRVSKAQRWLEQCEAPVCEAKVVNLTPVAGYVRVLLSQDSKESRDQAKSMMDVLLKDAEAARLTESQVQCLIMKSLWHAHEGNQNEARMYLGEAVCMAQHGGALRVFVDFGVELIPLLQKLKLGTEGVEYIGNIVRAMNPPVKDEPVVDSARIQSTVHMPLMESLSKREFEVLLLLAKHCSNNDISDQLFISLGTVKRHVSNIYQKLAVHGRKEAVAKALGLGLIK
ncbi:hypothetical protein HW115_15515 [Verrucomicrobiaceae bacterium N1E253]|uniref:HTH luxR-type domain-containing protein n=1 Tax=Oceaniferula marina TaxID=2748318 RepID=A0A851GQC9_9BACT|nr:LuxR C-terminal-related transcriptional regulator [Oceaniferula marina]NWK57030.1 hypothetical protein [Oceaniferula marina]